jgi:hypothetical protein
MGKYSCNAVIGSKKGRFSEFEAGVADHGLSFANNRCATKRPLRQEVEERAGNSATHVLSCNGQPNRGKGRFSESEVLDKHPTIVDVQPKAEMSDLGNGDW